MIVTDISNGYITIQLNQRDCQILALVHQVARSHPNALGDEATITLVETQGTLFTLAAIVASAQVNMCHADHLAHIEHLNQTALPLGLPQPVR